MSQSVSVRGSILVGLTPCVSPSSIAQCTRELVLGGACGDQGLIYEGTVVSRLSIATAGAVGANYVALPPLGQFTAIELLQLSASAQFRLRFTLPDASQVTTADLIGLQLYQFARSPNAPTAIEASGVATLDIIAAGRTSA